MYLCNPWTSPKTIPFVVDLVVFPSVTRPNFFNDDGFAFFDVYAFRGWGRSNDVFCRRFPTYLTILPMYVTLTLLPPPSSSPPYFFISKSIFGNDLDGLLPELVNFRPQFWFRKFLSLVGVLQLSGGTQFRPKKSKSRQLVWKYETFYKGSYNLQSFCMYIFFWTFWFSWSFYPKKFENRTETSQVMKVWNLSKIPFKTFAATPRRQIWV